MDIVMIDFQMCLHDKYNKKESYNCTDNINIYFKNITFEYKKVQMWKLRQVCT